MATCPDKRQMGVIDAVLSLIETGKLPSDESYRTCTILPDGAGISYGKHQSTDKSGTTDSIVLAYIDAGGLFAGELEPFLELLADDASAKVDPEDPPQQVLDLMVVLRKCGRDPVMQRVQDQVFGDKYWEPAKKLGMSIGLELPISYLALYDTTIQSSIDGVANIRKRFPAKPPSRGGIELTWVEQYLAAREDWLRTFTHGNKKKQTAVRSSVYRIEAIRQDIVEKGNTQLVTPLVFRGTTIP